MNDIKFVFMKNSDLDISIPKIKSVLSKLIISCPSVENVKVSWTVYINNNKTIPLEENANFK